MLIGVPIFDDPVVHFIRAIAHGQDSMVQLVSTAALIIINTTRVELELIT